MLAVGATAVSAALIALVAATGYFAPSADNGVVSEERKLSERNALAMKWVRDGLPRPAVSVLDEILLDHPDFLPALVNRSWALTKLGRFAEAVRDADRALKIQPNCVAALNNKAEALQCQGELAEAYKWAEQAIAADANCPGSWIAKANALAGMGQERWPGAIEAYDEALSLEPKNVQALAGKGWVLNYMEKYDEALKVHRTALIHAPGDHEVWRIGIFAMMRRDPNSTPIAMIRNALVFHPESPQLLNDRGLALLRQGQYADASDALTLATHHDRDSHLAWYNKALALGALGKKREAVEAVERSLRIKPDYEPAKQYRQRILNQDRADSAGPTSAAASGKGAPGAALK